jgi:hypothetical protein
MTGCVAVAAPSYMPEDEAMQVIVDELARHGITLTQRKVRWDDIVVKGCVWANAYNWVEDASDWNRVDIEDPLEVDGIDPAHHVAIEFLSYDDHRRFGGPCPAWEIDSHDVADRLRREVSRSGHDVYFASFYDPVTYVRFERIHAAVADMEKRDGIDSAASPETESGWDERRSRYEKAREIAGREARAESRENLRAQVVDFVDWLRGQGVI